MIDCSEKFCVVGAGSSGLAVAKNFKQAEIAHDVLERDDDVGGIWHYGRPLSSVYASTHLISSKRLTEFTDYRMPRSYPAYPNHRQVWEYFRSYAEHFGLYDHIQFGVTVKDIRPDDRHWLVELADGSTRRYRGIVIANGHNWDPNWPEIPGNFDGQILHSSQYKTPDVLKDRRVLVVGAGNSGCDLAVESAQHAAKTFHSTRRGYHYLPKFLLGKPIDECGETLLRWRFPLWLRRLITSVMVRVAMGTNANVGLATPDHKLFEAHPIINSQLYYFLGHGRITAKPDVTRLCGDAVEFSDDSREPIDLILYATGFKISFPFIDRQHLNWRDGRPELFMNVFHPQRDDLFVAGMIQPDSGQWGLVDYQAQLITRFLEAQQKDERRAEQFRRLKRESRIDLGDGIHYIRSHRHLLEVEHFSYRKRLKKLIATLQ